MSIKFNSTHPEVTDAMELSGLNYPRRLIFVKTYIHD